MISLESKIVYRNIDRRPSLFISLSNIDVNKERRKLNSNPHQKLAILKPFTNLLASKTTAALIMKRNKPSVSIVTGSVKSIINGFTKIFRIANTIAKMNAVQKSLT